MKKYILGFDEIKKDDVPTAGGKGANLGEMTSAGVPVPAGAVLTAQAYDRFMEYNSIDTVCGPAAIRAAVLGGELPDDMHGEIVDFYHSMGKNARVAVRSSATAEDLADASFAGQQETYLNVVGEAQLLEKIKECYASLWGDRAVSYRKVQGYDKQRVSLAVVIQQMVESESAGVLFTKDPSGLTEDIVINAAYGLGEAVVSGVVSPDEYRCGRDGTVKKAVIGSKEIRIIYSEGGTRTEQVSEELRAVRVLDDSLIKKLVDEALNIEKQYGRPMDIEWAVRDGKIYILQARCITTIGADRPVFTEKDFVGLPAVRPAKGRMRESIMFMLEKLPKPYYPLDHDFGGYVGAQKQVLFAEFGICMNDTEPIDNNGISSFGIAGLKPNSSIIKLPTGLKQMKSDEHNIREADRCLAEHRKRLADEKRKTYGSAAEIGKALERMRALIGDTAYARFRYAIFPQVVENISLERKLKKLDKELSSFDLMEGLSYVTADINRDMAVMAERIRADSSALEAVLNKPYRELVVGRPDIKALFDDFLGRYGCHIDLNCYCFASSSWNDDPDRFLCALRTLIRSGDSRVPTREEGKERFISLMHRMQRKLGRKGYAKFKKKVVAVRHYHYIREATQYLWESVFDHCRLLLKDCAAMLGTEYGDLLYLFADELFAVCRRGEISPEVRSKIGLRKAKRSLAEAYWNRCMELSLATEDSEIKGVCGSSGKAAGRVCVVRSPAEFDKLQRGEVLVCSYTDPEWTPLFTLASAVVVDTGGTLSHAAIVAREYGIPAVLATGSATRLLKDGDTVIVDGTNGTVSFVEQTAK